MPKNIKFEGDLIIYGDLVSIMSLDKYDIHAITIDSKPIARMHRDLFYEIWGKAKPLI